MATEQGIVIRTDTETAWVKTQKTKACEGCSSKGACSVMGGGEEMEVEAINAAGGKVGDRVVLSFETASLLKATFLVYIIPVICLLIGALIGQKLALILTLNESMSAAIGSLLFGSLAILFVKIKGNRMAQQEEYRPKVIRILKQQQ
jgi:sigma-E factor negative regulatory protein RseC